MSTPTFRQAGDPALSIINPISRKNDVRALRQSVLPLILLGATALAGCATTQRPPEISYDDPQAAVLTVAPPAPVQVVELPRPLPLSNRAPLCPRQNELRPD